MSRFNTFIKVLFGGVITSLNFIFGGWDYSIQALIIIMIIDYLTGISKSYVNSKLSSDKGFRGIIKKICMLGLVAVAVILDKVTGNSGLIRTFIIYYLIANEGLSIIENLGEMNIIVPDFLKKKLEQLRNGNNKEKKD